MAISDELTHPGLSMEGAAPAEQHYAPNEIAARWCLNVETIRRMFQNEPGIVVLQGPIKKGKRPYKTIRIPHSVLERVHKRLQR
jgi:hypothetical protein